MWREVPGKGADSEFFRAASKAHSEELMGIPPADKAVVETVVVDGDNRVWYRTGRGSCSGGLAERTHTQMIGKRAKIPTIEN